MSNQSPPSPTGTESWGVKEIAIADTMWLVVLMLLLVGRLLDWFDAVANPVGGIVWLIVPWAGALGGVAISLVGVCRYNGNWDTKRNYWHLFRPVLGAIFGVFGVLVVTLIVGSVTSVDSSTDWATLSPSAVAILAVIAFVSGYRESTVRELMKAVWDTIFTPRDGKDPDVVPAVTVTPASLAFDNAGITRTIVIKNDTTTELTIVGVWSSDDTFTILGPQENAAIPAGASHQIAVQAPDPLAGGTGRQLTVVLSNGEGFVVDLTG